MINPREGQSWRFSSDRRPLKNLGDFVQHVGADEQFDSLVFDHFEQSSSRSLFGKNGLDEYDAIEDRFRRPLIHFRFARRSLRAAATSACTKASISCSVIPVAARSLRIGPRISSKAAP